MKYIVLVYYSSIIFSILFQCITWLKRFQYYFLVWSTLALILFQCISYLMQNIYICMVAGIEMADRPHDDLDYMEDVIQNMIDNGSQYFIDYNEIMQENPTEQQEGNALEQQPVVQQEGNTGKVCKYKHI